MASTTTYSDLDKYAGLSSGDIEPYTAKVQSIETASQIGYYRINESAGAVAIDLSPQADDGTYTSVTLGETGIGDGQTSGKFVEATPSDLDVSVILPNFDPDLFTFNIWLKCIDEDMLTDGSQYDILSFGSDSDNLCYLCKSVGLNLFGYRYKSGGVDVTQHKTGVVSTGWHAMGMVVDQGNDKFQPYWNGEPIASGSGFGPWAGAVGSMIVGNNSGKNTGWDGWLAHCTFWDCALSDNDMARLSRL